jgi:hypothetical protein
MKRVLALLALIIVPVLSFSQDVRVRQEATQLLERSNAATTVVKPPNLERTDTFRVFGSDGIKEGTFTRVVIQGTGRREETTFGDYHVLNVFTDHNMATVRTHELVPAEIATLMRITPIFHVRFDGEDVIHSITNREVHGQAARCIEFDTVKGQKTDANEICVAAANGALLLEKVGDELIENSEFFSFAGALVPGRIDYSFAGVRKMEITQVMEPLTDTTANVLVAPPDADMRHNCRTFRRPFGQYMPQPKPGNGGTNVDVIVRGLIMQDGKIHDAVVQSSVRPDLNAEALNLIHQWVFTPGLCEDHPGVFEAIYALHFQGR